MRLTISSEWVDSPDITVTKTGASIMIDTPKKIKAVDLLKILKLIMSHLIK